MKNLEILLAEFNWFVDLWGYSNSKTFQTLFDIHFDLNTFSSTTLEKGAPVLNEEDGQVITAEIFRDKQEAAKDALSIFSEKEGRWGESIIALFYYRRLDELFLSKQQDMLSETREVLNHVEHLLNVKFERLGVGSRADYIHNLLSHPEKDARQAAQKVLNGLSQLEACSKEICLDSGFVRIFGSIALEIYEPQIKW